MAEMISRATRTTNKNKVVFRSYGKMENGEFKFITPEVTYPKCGEIWKCDLGENDGSIQSGYRPVFILSNNKNNKFSTTVNVFPLTTKMNKRNLPVHVELWDYEEYGLSQPSTILVEQPMTVSVDKLTRRLGAITDAKMLQKICEAMGIQFPIISICMTTSIKQ